MSRAEKIKDELRTEFEQICLKKGIPHESFERMLQAERIKKLYRRNHYILQTIDKEIENSIEELYEN